MSKGATMPTRETAPIGAPCWVDLMTSDTEHSRAFYGELFGWAAEEPAEEFGGYFNFTRAGVRVAGCMARQPGAEVPDVWSVYLATDDARKTVDAAVANGGQVLVPAMDVGDLGVMAVVNDPGGAAIGLWQPGLHQGFGLLGESGAPSWFELHTRDYQAAVGFYRNVFRWDTHVVSDTPEFRYTTLRHGEGWLAGIMDASSLLPDGVAAHWSVYFGVEDTDAALAETVNLGGSIALAAEDTLYGRLAAAADPTGAQFKLVAPNAAMPGSGGVGVGTMVDRRP
jgi:predicted enzyme related to lactoylglutathione lyase